MNTKGTILLLAAALAVGGAIYYQNQKEEQSLVSAAIPVQTLPAITSGTVERILINAPDQDAVTLTKSGDKWYTNVERQHEADAGAIIAIMGALEKPITATVVSSNPNSFAEYQVTETSSTKVQVYQNGSTNPVLDLLIGRDGQSVFSTYVRKADSKEVLNAQASLAKTFNREDGWRDRRIFNFSGSNATRIEETGISATFVVTKSNDEKWLFAEPAPGEADAARINSLANMLASLQADRFVETTATPGLAGLGLEPPRQTISLYYEDKSTSPSTPTSATLFVGNELDPPPAAVASGAGAIGGWYAKSADKADIFIISKQAAEALFPDPESIRITPPPLPATEDVPTSNTEPIAGSEMESEPPAAVKVTSGTVAATEATTAATMNVDHADTTATLLGDQLGEPSLPENASSLETTATSSVTTSIVGR